MKTEDQRYATAVALAGFEPFSTLRRATAS